MGSFNSLEKIEKIIESNNLKKMIDIYKNHFTLINKSHIRKLIRYGRTKMIKYYCFYMNKTNYSYYDNNYWYNIFIQNIVTKNIKIIKYLGSLNEVKKSMLNSDILYFINPHPIEVAHKFYHLKTFIILSKMKWLYSEHLISWLFDNVIYYNVIDNNTYPINKQYLLLSILKDHENKINKHNLTMVLGLKIKKDMLEYLFKNFKRFYNINYKIYLSNKLSVIPKITNRLYDCKIIN